MDMRLPNTFSIFPVNGKRPLVEWGEYRKRYATPQEKQAWEPLNKTGYGIVTGPISKILVLDDDGGLARGSHQIPRTLTQSTPRGGKHYFFRWTPELENKITTKVGILDKVDVRGDGGFVVFYGFQKPHFLTPLALPPQWLLDLLPNKHPNNDTRMVTENSEKSQLEELLNGIKSGNRNDTFARIAGSLRRRAYSSADIFGILSSKAREVGFDLGELRLICNSIGRYEPERQEITDTEQATSIEEFLKDQQKVEWIVPGLIAKRSIGFVAGLPETGKTWMMIDLAIKCAKGGLWLNKFPAEKQKVLFIDQERFKGETQRRFKSVIAGQNFAMSSITTSLLVKSGSTTRLNLQHSFDAFRKELSELRPQLVIVDSFATFSTAEENNRKDIQVVLEKIKELRNEFGCTFLFISHENKAAFSKDPEAGDPSISQMAGSVAIPAAAELVLTVRKQDSESSMIYNTKNTLSQSIAPFLIKVIDIAEGKIKVEAY